MQNLKRTVLFIGAVWPEPKSSAAGTRIIQLMSLFDTDKFDLVFASSAIRGDYSAVVDLITEKQIEINSNSFDDLLKELTPSYVIFDRFMIEEQFGWRVAQTCPGAIRILDTEDLHCLRKSRENSLKINVKHTFEMILSEEVALREIASILRCDISLIISEVEMEILNTIFKIDSALLHYLPLFAEKSSVINTYLERRDFLFIGNFLHKPNADCVQYLKTVVWPLVRKRLHVNLHIYGAYMPEWAMQYNDPGAGFIVHGRAEDALEVISRAKVLLAPIRVGAGLKGKLLEAMSVGTPSMTSSVGAEGISEVEWNGFVEDDLHQFVDRAVELYDNHELWDAKQKIGFNIIRERFRMVQYKAKFINRLDNLSANSTDHRVYNFLGRMLQHHTMRSTEFMSRWIQEKNKK